MKTTAVDRALVMWIAAALTVWSACLVVLWSHTFGAGGASLLLTVAALMLSLRVGAVLPGGAARAAQRVLARLKLQDLLSAELARARGSTAGKREVRAMMRLLGGSCLLAVVCGAATTACIYAAEGPVEWLGREFVWPAGAWLVIELLAKTVGMLPMALCIGVAFLTGAIVRRGSGRDTYATICRDWMWSVAMGLTIFALLWRLGLNLLAVAGAMGVALLGGAMLLFLRQKLTLRPRRMMRPIESPPRRRCWGIAAGFAALAVVLAVQGRILTDVAAADVSGRMCWTALSVGLLAWFMRRQDHKSRPPGGAQAVGAVVGVAGCLLAQGALWISLPGASRAGGALCGAFAALGQVPLAALAAILLSRQRRLFATASGPARQYVASAALGMGLALPAYLLLASEWAGRMLGLAVVLALPVAAVVRAIIASRRKGDPLRWAASGACLVCSLAAAVLIGACDVGNAGGVTPGVWLSAVTRNATGRGSASGVLPAPGRWRSGMITAAIARIAASPRCAGRWWVVATDERDLPADLGGDGSVRVTGSAPDATALRAGAGELVRPGPNADFFRVLARGRRKFDIIFLAPLPADHPEAWRCYHLRLLNRARRRAHEGAPVLLRTQTAPGRLGEAIAVARCFRLSFGAGWAAVAINQAHADILLGTDNIDPPARGADLVVVSLDALLETEPDIRPMRLESPLGPPARRGISADELLSRARGTGRP